MASSGAEFGRTLRERRRALGLTRTRLAERTGLTVADLGKWERGEDAPGPDEISVLAEAAGFDEDETRAWLDAVVAVDITGPEVSVEIVEGADPPLDPIQRRTQFGRGAEPAASLRVAPASAPNHPTPAEGSGLIRRPRPSGRQLPSVFPDVRYADYDPAVRVYSAAPASFPSPDDDRIYLLRRLRTAGVLLTLAVVLWWAFGALGEGMSDLLDLFRAPPEAPLITGG